MKNKGDLERERDELKAEIDNNNNKVQVLERTIEHLKKTIDEKVIKLSRLFAYLNFAKENNSMHFLNIFQSLSCESNCTYHSAILGSLAHLNTEYQNTMVDIPFRSFKQKAQ